MKAENKENKKQEILGHHFKYEMFKMNFAYEFLQEFRAGKISFPSQYMAQHIYDIVYEAFCLHARNLVEFFFLNATGDHANAKDFTNDSYTSIDDKRIKRIYGTLCAQITHLTYNRTAQPEDKLVNRHNDIKFLVDAVNKEAKRFVEQVDEKYHDDVTKDCIEFIKSLKT